MSKQYTRIVPMTNAQILSLSNGLIDKPSKLISNFATSNVTTSLNNFNSDMDENTIFSSSIFGDASAYSTGSSIDNYNFGHIELSIPYISPLGLDEKNMSSPIQKMLNMKKADLVELLYGEAILVVPTNKSTYITYLLSSDDKNLSKQDLSIKKVVKEYSLHPTLTESLVAYVVSTKSDNLNVIDELKKKDINFKSNIIISGAFAIAFLLSMINPEKVEHSVKNILKNPKVNKAEKKAAVKRLKYVKKAMEYGSLLDYVLFYYPVIPIAYRAVSIDTTMGTVTIGTLNEILHNLMTTSIQFQEKTNILKPNPSLYYNIDNICKLIKDKDSDKTTAVNKLLEITNEYYYFFTSKEYLTATKNIQLILSENILADKKDPSNKEIANPKSKSIMQRLSKKNGLLRENVMDRRTDYSGRSVIVVNPNLKLDEISIPYDIVKKWFSPLLLEKLKRFQANSEDKMSDDTLKSIIINYKPLPISTNESTIDKRLIDIYQIIHETLDEEIKKVATISIRYPSLHKWNTLGSNIVIDYYSRAIGIHPLIVSSYNADFDGDQKAEILIQTPKAVEELREVMLPSKNLYDAEGKPRHILSQECVSGIYVATMLEDESLLDNPVKNYANLSHLISDYELGHINITDVVKVYSMNKVSTVGRFLLSNKLPNNLGLVNREEDLHGLEIEYLLKNLKAKGMTKKCISKLLGIIIEQFSDDVDKIIFYHDMLKDFGYSVITRYGLSISLSDLKEPENRQQLIDEYESDYLELNNNTQLSNHQLYQMKIDRGMKFSYDMLDAVKTSLDFTNPIKILIDSGSRGNWEGAVQLLGARGIMEDPNGTYIPKAVTTNFTSGISLDNGIIGSYGGANGSVSKSKLTATTGALARDLVYAMHNLSITQGDCGDTEGYLIEPICKNQVTRDIYGNLQINVDNVLQPIFIFNITKLVDTDDVIITYDGNIIIADTCVYNIYSNRVIEKNSYNKYKTIINSIIEKAKTVDIYGGSVVEGYELKDFIDINHFKIYKDDKLVLDYCRDYYLNDFKGRILGQDLDDFQKGDYLPDNVNEAKLLNNLNKYPFGVYVRSPLSCKSPNGVCSKCFGRSQVDYPKALVPVASLVGMLTAHVTGEIFTQTSMRVFHTGGTAIGGSTKSLFGSAKAIIDNNTLINTSISNKLNKEYFDLENVEDLQNNSFIGIKTLYKEHKGIPSGLKNNLTYEDLGIVNYGVYIEATSKYLLELKSLFIQSNFYLDSIYFESIIKELFSVVTIVDSGDSDITMGSDITFFKFNEINRNLINEGKTPALAKVIISSINQISSAAGTDSTYLKMSYTNLKKNLIEGVGNYGLALDPDDNDNILPVVSGKKFPIGSTLRKKLVDTYSEIENGTFRKEKIVKDNNINFTQEKVVKLSHNQTVKEIQEVVIENTNVSQPVEPIIDTEILAPNSQQEEVLVRDIQENQNLNTIFGGGQ